MNTLPLIKKRINHDSMWISCKFRSGESFKLKILRYKKVLEHKFHTEDGHKIFMKWVESSEHQTYGSMFNKLHALCLTCRNGIELINLLHIENCKNYGN